MATNQSGSSLVIGGTGMLAKATLWLAERSTETVVIARHASRFASEHTGIVPIDADWNTGYFRNTVTNAAQSIEPIGSALLWLHHPSPVLAWLLPLLPKAKTVLVLGSMAGYPSIPAGDFIPVRLGSKGTADGHRRWLTDDEICDAAIAALTHGQPQIAGELHPL